MSTFNLPKVVKKAKIQFSSKLLSKYTGSDNARSNNIGSYYREVYVFYLSKHIRTYALLVGMCKVLYTIGPLEKHLSMVSRFESGGGGVLKSAIKPTYVEQGSCSSQIWLNMNGL